MEISQSNGLEGSYWSVATLLFSELQEIVTLIKFYNGNTYDLHLMKNLIVPLARNELPMVFSVLTDTAAKTLEIKQLVIASGLLPMVDFIKSGFSMNPRADFPSDFLTK